jgi:pimeloyl-ACP methyl ester carboxylesterase
MPDPVLIIPGTQATTLVDDGGRSVYNAVRVGIPLLPKSLGGRPKSEWVELLSMEHEPGELEPVKTSLEPGTTIDAPVVLQTPYNQFPKFFEEWPYDWRADLRWNAGRLLGDLRSRARDGSPRVSLIGHSQGALLITLASKQADPGEFARLVSRVIFVGAPFAGTMRAVEALVFGSTDLGVRDQLLALRMARTWPAIYQMLPAWACVTDAQGKPLPADEQLLQLTGWPDGSNDGVTADMLDRAVETQKLLVDPFAGFGPGISVTTIMGSNQETGDTLIRAGDGFTKIVTQKRAGDNLVPFDRTIAWGGNPFHFTVVPFAGQTRPHAELCCDVGVAPFIVSRVNAPAPMPPA